MWKEGVQVNCSRFQILIFNICYFSWTREFILHNRVHPWISLTYAFHCFTFFFIVLWFCLPFSVAVPSGLGGGKNGRSTHFLLSRGLCVPTIVKEMECITGLILLKFQDLTFQMLPSHRGMTAENNLPAYCANICKCTGVAIVAAPTQPETAETKYWVCGWQLFTPGGREIVQSFACCFGFFVLGV